ncbi:MAG: nuclear transport factor 2 family protein [Kordiimonadaceae bacterium]|nr:nuclear transport factor 2 family protein [Kordiimonadaceae bacterium]
MKLYSKIMFIVALAITGSFGSAASDDEIAIKEAVTNYVHGFYEGDKAKLDKALHESLRKVGWGRDVENDSYRGPYSMTKESAKEFAPRWAERAKVGTDGHLVITVFDIMDKIASAKVEARWGVDYFHLAKEDDGWKIYNVIWQGYSDGKTR